MQVRAGLRWSGETPAAGHGRLHIEVPAVLLDEHIGGDFRRAVMPCRNEH
jgi:hypothetical protein